MTADEQRREKAIDLMVQALVRQFFPFGGADRDLLRTLVEPIVDHHVACTARIGREG